MKHNNYFCFTDGLHAGKQNGGFSYALNSRQIPCLTTEFLVNELGKQIYVSLRDMSHELIYCLKSELC